MNLLGKIKSVGALALGLILFNSCEEKGNFGFGSEDLAPVEFAIEEVGVNSSVVVLDSIQTSTAGAGLIGQINDPNFGEIKGVAYSKLNLRKLYLGSLDDEAILDSAQISLKFNSIYNENLPNLGFRAYKLGEAIEDTTHYTKDQTVITDELIVSGDLIVSNLDSTYVLNVDADWSTNLFQMLKDGADEVKDQEAFEFFFPGLAFTATEATKNVFGLSLSSSDLKITFYYRNLSGTGNVDNNQTHEMTLGDLVSYYGLEQNKEGTPTEELNEKNTELYPSSGLRYLQAGTGILTKLDISDFETFSEANEGLIINSAQISVGPIQALPEGVAPPASLFLLITNDQNNRIVDGTAYRAIQEDASNQIGSGLPLRLIYDEETRIYTASITTYFSAYYAGAFRRNQLLFYPANANSNISQAIFDPADISIKIFYSSLR